jgi:ribosomal protein S27AE
MGLKCSLLGHAYEPADFEREREKQGSEVVTVTREIERCVRCGEERVVSESTEVTAVVDEEEVELDRSTGGGDGTDRGADAGGSPGSPAGDEFAARDPAEEDAEILTDEEPGREPGAWPEDPDEGWDPDETPTPDSDDERTTSAPASDADDEPVAPDEETLSGITVPEGRIVCTECEFGVDAESSYRDGDPCPECGAWLTSERNR